MMGRAEDDALKTFDLKRKAKRCPVCDAGPGEDCKELGVPVRWVHWSRYEVEGMRGR